MIELHNIDCMEYMRGQPDKAFDLAIVDPMYDMPENYLRPGSSVSTTGIKRKHNDGASKLAKLPITGYPYYNELLRVSKNQIIWGINYFEFAGSVCGRIVWDKKNDDSTFSNCELASCSIIKGTRIFRFMWNGMLQENMAQKEVRQHPFQKPVALYKWLLKNYAKEGDKILDTHLGSGSIAIACHDYKFDLVGCELDKDYFEAASKRLKNHQAQLSFV